MDRATLKAGSGYTNTVSSPWAVAGVGDYDGTSKADVVWRNGAAGEDFIFRMNATTVHAG